MKYIFINLYFSKIEIFPNPYINSNKIKQITNQ